MDFSLESVSKRFGNVVALDDITLTAKAGEFVVLLGPSGCGKTTLLRIVAGLETPDAGGVKMGGRDITHLEPRDRDVAMVFQSYALYPHMTVAQNISYPLKVRKRTAAEMTAETATVAGKLGLTELLGRRPKEVSGGQRQRVALARAMVRRPQAFLMDEPLSNLDAQLRVETRFELKHLQQELNVLTLYVTHDQAEAMTLADRIAVIHQGRLLQYETPAHIYNRPANQFVAGFLGSPSMNFIDAQVEGGALVRQEWSIPLEENQLAAVGPRSRLTLGIRPEDVEVSIAEKDGWDPANVYVAEELGNETLVRLSADSFRITARVDPDQRIGSGDRVWFRLNPAKLHFFDADTQQALRPARQ